MRAGLQVSPPLPHPNPNPNTLLTCRFSASAAKILFMSGCCPGCAAPG